ncbi:polycystin-1 isoform X2 [Silurus meridionalis]|nr:polycystin-1 isoform X2 [Silurus meridionalis]
MADPQICVRAMYLAGVVKPVDPEVEDRLAQETVVMRMEKDQDVDVRPLCGYGLLHAKEEARKVRILRNLMKNCLIYLLFLLVVLLMNYQDNIQETNSRLLHSAVKRSIISALPGQPNLTALSGGISLAMVVDGGISGAVVEDRGSSGAVVVDRGISGAVVVDGEISGAVVEDGGISGSMVEDRGSSGAVVVDDGISGAVVVDEGISGAVFVDGGISEAVLVDGGISGAVVVDGGISGAVLVDGGISGAVVVDGGIIGAVVVDGGISGAVLVDGGISGAVVVDGGISGAVLVDEGISGAVFVDGGISEAVLVDGGISGAVVVDGGISGAVPWSTAQSCVLTEADEMLLGNSSFYTTHILSDLKQAQWITTEHRWLHCMTDNPPTTHPPEPKKFLAEVHQINALLLIFSLCFLSAEVWRIFRERAQYLTQGWHLFQLLVALLSFSAASLRFCFLSMAAECLSDHVSQPETFTGFHNIAALAKSSSQLSAVLLMFLVPQLFSASVEGFRTVRQASESLLCLLRNRFVLRQLSEEHPVLGPIFCLAVFGLGFWLLGRLCGAVLLQRYKNIQAEMYRPSMEPQDYEMVEFLIKRLKLWMGLSKIKEFRHRVKFEGMESPPSRSSQFSSISPPVSPPRPRLVSASSQVSESSTISESHEVQQYLDRLLPSVDNLLASFDRVNQLTNDILNIEEQLQEILSRIVQKRRKHNQPKPQMSPATKLARPSQTSLPMSLKALRPSNDGIPQAPSNRRATHSESSLMAPSAHLTNYPRVAGTQKSQTVDQEIRGFPRRRAWHSGSCHSADTIQRFAKSQSPGAIPVRPHSEESDWTAASGGMPIKKKAWHTDSFEIEKG